MRTIREWVRALVSLHGTPAGIAGGFTLGLALSLVPIPFAGMLVALAAAPLLRCNLPATYLGSAVVNPVTGPAFYFAELWIGLHLTDRAVPGWDGLTALDATGWWHLFLELLGPFLLGAGVLIVASAAVAFPALLQLSRLWQRKYPSGAKTPAQPHDGTSPPEGSRVTDP